MPGLETTSAKSTFVELAAEEVHKSFGEQQVLRGISVKIQVGELIAIVGASGSGKTVFLDHLIGLIKPDSGRILAADHDAQSGSSDSTGQPPLRDINAITEDELDQLRLHWSVVFQRNALFTGSVRENVALWLREHTSLAELEIDKRIRDSLAAADLEVDDVIEKDRDALSGGMAKRVAIARAIAVDPRVLFYDEPTTGLDPVVAGRIHELVWDVHHKPVGTIFDKPAAPISLDGTGPATNSEHAPPKPVPRTSILVTHDKELLRRIHPRVLMLHEGAVCFDGPYDKFGGPDCPPAQEYLQAMPVLHARHAR